MTYVSPRSMDIAGYPPGEWLTQPDSGRTTSTRMTGERAITETDAAINALNSIRVEYRFRVATGEYRWFSDVIRVIRKADGAGHRLVGVMIDITDQKRIEETLAYRAAHDTLTGLLNREQLDIELARVHDRPEPWALLFLDLNGFKDINDGLGHSVGDEVLRIIAKRLSGATRPGDTVARFGGDEFCVLACVAEEDTAVTIAHRLREAVEAPARVGGHTLRLAVTVGIAYVGPDGHAGDAAATGRRGDVQRQEPRIRSGCLRAVDAQGGAAQAERHRRVGAVRGTRPASATDGEGHPEGPSGNRHERDAGEDASPAMRAEGHGAGQPE